MMQIQMKMMNNYIVISGFALMFLLSVIFWSPAIIDYLEDIHRQLEEEIRKRKEELNNQ